MRSGAVHASGALMALALVCNLGVARSVPAVPSSMAPGQPMTIVTDPPYDGDACQSALRGSVHMRRSGSEVVFSGNGEDEPLVWPNGTSAWIVDGKLALFTKDGSLIATEDETLPDLGGGLGVDGRFHVCSIDRRA